MVAGETIVRERLTEIPAVEVVQTRPVAVRRITWGAVFAGWAAGFTLQLVFTTLGAGIGLAALEPATGNDPGQGFAIAAGAWWIITGIISFFAGGWVAGRLSGLLNPVDASLHGLLVWAVAGVVGLAFLTTSAASLIGGAFGPLARGIDRGALTADRGVTGGLGAVGSEVINQAGQMGTTLPQRRETPGRPRGAEMGTGQDRSGTPGESIERPGDGRGDDLGATIPGDEPLRRDDRISEPEVRAAADKAADVGASASLWSFFGLTLGGIAAAVGGLTGRPECPRP
jgi:hypothetical protein